MAKIPNSVKKLLNKYIDTLNSNGIEIKSAYIFGSYAKGNFTKMSDIDVALISDSFEGIRFYDKNKIRKLTLSISFNIEAMPFNPSDFSLENPFAKEIMSTGIKIA